jgi:hypothetical protein
VSDVDAVHARAVERGLEIAYQLRDEEWGVRRFMLREPSGTIVNVLSHRSGSSSRREREREAIESAGGGTAAVADGDGGNS